MESDQEQQATLAQLLANCRGTFFALSLQLRHAREHATGAQADQVQWIIGQLAELRHRCGEEVLSRSLE